MLNLTRKTDYALVALAHLAEQRSGGEANVSARRIAEQFGMPLPLLMNILKELAHAQIVRSTRGINGGYELAVAPDQVSILDVVSAMEGPFRLSFCSKDALAPDEAQPENATNHGRSECQIAGCCPIREPIQRLHERLYQFLDGVTLSDLIQSKVDVTTASITRSIYNKPEASTSSVS